MNRRKLLAEAALFRNFAPSEVDLLDPIVVERAIAAGETILKEGSQADALYIIESGEVEVLKEDSKGSKLVITELASGAHFGEMAFIDHSRRAASVAAKHNTKVLEIRYADLEKLIRAKPEIGLKLFRSLAETLCIRIRQTTGELSHLFLG